MNRVLLIVGTFLVLWAEEGFRSACAFTRLALAEEGFRSACAFTRLALAEGAFDARA